MRVGATDAVGARVPFRMNERLQQEDVEGLFRLFGGDASGYREFPPPEIPPQAPTPAAVPLAVPVTATPTPMGTSTR